MLLAALGSCSATDVVYALKEQEVEIRRFCNEVTFQLTDSSPRLYKSVNLHFIVEAAGVTKEQILQAAKDAVNKYCHVCLMLQPNIHITYTCDVI
ncbi:OsmC family protein [Endozoicomonas ascidiicola]|uniref:OsmC family protein n=1 Tax=Endozoicomonas ascidiicola TaxID=1698521 RepID=UPI003CCC0EB6